MPKFARLESALAELLEALASLKHESQDESAARPGRFRRVLGSIRTRHRKKPVDLILIQGGRTDEGDKLDK